MPVEDSRLPAQPVQSCSVSPETFPPNHSKPTQPHCTALQLHFTSLHRTSLHFTPTRPRQDRYQAIIPSYGLENLLVRRRRYIQRTTFRIPGQSFCFLVRSLAGPVPTSHSIIPRLLFLLSLYSSSRIISYHNIAYHT